MIDRTHKILIAFGIILAAVMLFVSRPLGKRERGNGNVTAAGLEARIRDLEAELSAFAQLKVSSDRALKREKEKTCLLERKIAEEKPDKIDSAPVLRKKDAAAARRADERSSLERKLAKSEKTAAVLKEANRSLSEGLKAIEKELADIDSKQALLIKEKKDAVREKLEAVKNAGVMKDKLLSFDKGNQELFRRRQSLKAELSNLQAASGKLGAEKETIRKELEDAKAAGANARSMKEKNRPPAEPVERAYRGLRGFRGRIRESLAGAPAE